MIGEIILDGRKVEVGAPVVTWEEHGMTWKGPPNVVAREIDPSLVIWHWTGGENSPEGFFGTLNNRGLGISFYVTREGDIYQYADPVKVDPKDTGGGMGRRSISIEIAGYGFLWPVGKTKTGRGADRIVDRGVRVHGVRYDIARFYEQQLTATAALTKVLCEELDIPRKFPREEDGLIMHREMTNPEKRAFNGVCGHFHKTDQKVDPGYHIFDVLGYLEAA